MGSEEVPAREDKAFGWELNIEEEISLLDMEDVGTRTFGEDGSWPLPLCG